jgi:hypothetical protein
MENELKKQQIRFLSLLNGLMAISYIVGGAYLLAQIYNIIVL